MGEPSGEGDADDPDAPWRPGFRGWSDDVAHDRADEEPAGDRPEGSSRSLGRRAVEAASEPVAPEDPDPHAARRTSGARRLQVRTVLAGAVAIVSVVVAVVVLRSDGDGPALAAALQLPEALDHRWTSTFDRRIDDVAVGSGLLVVGASGGLTAFELETGQPVWSRPQALGGRDTPIDQIAIVADVILVQLPGPGTGSEVAAFDRLTGDEIWRTGADDGRHTLIDPNGQALLLRRRRVDDGNVVELIDPLDGQPLGDPLPLSSVTAVGRDLGVQPAERTVAIWSPDLMEVVAGPVDAFDLRAVAALDGTVVALDLDGRIAAFDDAGVRTDEQLVAPPAGSSPDVRADLAGVASPVAIVAGEVSLGFTVEDGDIVVTWERPGRVAAPVVTDRGALGLLVEPVADGQRRETIVRVVDGATISVLQAGRERLPLLARNGYVLAPDPAADERMLDAYDYDGRRLWSLPIGPGAEYELLDDAVVILDRSTAGSVLTVAR